MFEDTPTRSVRLGEVNGCRAAERRTVPRPAWAERLPVDLGALAESQQWRSGWCWVRRSTGALGTLPPLVE